MLTCLPKSICSWNYQVRGTESGAAEITQDYLTEQGSIALGGMTLRIAKHGWTSGRWTLDTDHGPYAEAHKPSAMRRSFEVQAGERQFTVSAASTLGRTFNITADGRTLGTIRPAHALTRRAFIECDAAVPELVQLFAFWLAVLMWRRAASNNS